MKRIALLVVLLSAIGVPVASGLVNDKKKTEPDDPIMYVVPKGSGVYHKTMKCVTLRKSKTINEISLTNATLMGYSPCLQCSPPVREIVLEKPIQVTVEKLLADSEKFDGKRVEIKGTVVERTGFDGGKLTTSLVLADREKKISVFSNRAVMLELNDKVVVTGMFSKETSKIDASPIRGKVEVQMKADEKKEVEKKTP